MTSSYWKRLCAFLALAAYPLSSQTVSLRGQVSDESGAVIPAARISLTGPSGLSRTSTSAMDGRYTFTGLAPGNYTVMASAPNLELPQPAKIALTTGVATLNLQLGLVSTAQRVTVQDNAGPALTADAAGNASALVLRGADLDALADNPDDLQADLMALAGPSAGPGGGAIYIDGFSGGQLPAKESIREIRINQNPFSPEYDRLGYGRIEIFTKPGTDKFHGTGFYNFGDAFWNTRNPYAQQKAPFLLKEYGGNLSGPIDKHGSFFLDVQRHAIDNGAIINAITLDPGTLAIIDPFTAVSETPQRRFTVSPRVDYQLNANNTVTLRYGFARLDIRDAGIGAFNLVSRGYHVENTSHTAQISETAVLGTRAVNETRFQFFRVDSSTVANSFAPAIQVLQSFNAGGAPVGHSSQTQNSYEFQNYTSVVRKAHAWRFGVRLRGETEASLSPQNFGGTFTFGGGIGPDSAPVQSIERYRRTLLYQQQGLSSAQIRAAGGGATQFSVNSGVPEVSANQIDVGAFVGDDWRARPNLTLSLGLRYETQTNIHDWRDFAPRIGLAWAPRASAKNSRPKTVIRAGFGAFYDRFNLANTLLARRYDGKVQQQFVISNPDFFPLVPPISSLSALHPAQTVQQIDATLRAPYILQSALAIERQLPFSTTVALTYANSHGLHMLRSQAIAASSGPLFLMESSGLYNQNQWIVNVNSKVNSDISLFGSYVYNRAMSNTDGLGTFPANPRDFTGEYSPASTDLRHRLSLGGSINAMWGVRLNPLIVIDSGPPFDITAGRDVYGNTLFNGRPGIAVNPNKPGLVLTRYGLLDPDPTPDERILPRNYGRGPGSVLMNLRLSRAFAFGPSTERSDAAWTGPGSGAGRRDTGGAFGSGVSGAGATVVKRRYSLNISMSIRNLLNHTNPGPIIGNITSPRFGQANQPAGSLGGTGLSEAANNRRLELQTRLTF